MKAKATSKVKAKADSIQEHEQDSFKILKLAKDNLKFSAAHFLIFDRTKAERLHGHNYQVQIEIAWRSADLKNKPYNFYVNFSDLKKILKKEVDAWDEYILLPKHCPEMNFKVQGKSLDVQFRDRNYRFPKNEVILLPVENTSVELLSQLFCKNVWEKIKVFSPSGVRIYIEETKGQGAISSYGQL